MKKTVLQNRRGACLVIAALWVAPVAMAQTEGSPQAAQPGEDNSDPIGLRFAAGFNLRTDLGVHSTRVDLTARYQDFELDLVVDPMLWTNGQMHNDLLLQWHSGVGIAPLLGLRLSTLPLLDGPQMQYNALLGVAADLPSFFNGAVRGQAGFELAMTVVKSGGGLPAETISFESGRTYIDLVNMALFVRYNFGLGL